MEAASAYVVNFAAAALRFVMGRTARRLKAFLFTAHLRMAIRDSSMFI